MRATLGRAALRATSAALLATGATRTAGPTAAFATFAAGTTLAAAVLVAIGRTGRPGRMDLVAGKGAVAVFVGLFKGLGSLGDFLGGKLAVMVAIKGRHDGRLWGPGMVAGTTALSTLTAFALGCLLLMGGAVVFGGLFAALFVAAIFIVTIWRTLGRAAGVEFLAAELAIAVFVEGLERIGGGGDFRGGDLVVAVGVEGHDQRRRRPVVARAAGTAGAARAVVIVGCLGVDHAAEGQQRRGAEQPRGRGGEGEFHGMWD